jgi:hypothetical protein
MVMEIGVRPCEAGRATIAVRVRMILLFSLAFAAPCPEIGPRAAEPLRPPDPPETPAGEGEGALRVHVTDDADAPLAGVAVLAVGPGGAVRRGETDDGGELLVPGLPAGGYNLAAGGVTLQGVRIAADRTTVHRIRLRGLPSLQAADPGEPPSDATWLRYSRSGCLGPCEAFGVTVEHGGRLTFDGRAFVRVEGTARRVLSSRRSERLRDQLDCVRTLPSFGAMQATDHVWTRLEVWELDGSRWSWVWYSGDFRGPYEPLDGVRRRLERVMGIGRFD